MNYRRLYEDMTGEKIPKGYEIHHIDFNKKNNDIDNLVMLPKKLHRKLHKHITMYNYQQYELDLKVKSIIETGHATNSYLKNYIISDYLPLLETLMKCNMWVDYKMYVMGVIPNIHNIQLGETKNGS